MSEEQKHDETECPVVMVGITFPPSNDKAIALAFKISQWEDKQLDGKETKPLELSLDEFFTLARWLNFMPVCKHFIDEFNKTEEIPGHIRKEWH